MLQPTDGMLNKVGSALREHCGTEPGALIVVGVSGGADSLCLMHLLHALGYPLVVAHFDHQLRAESADDAAAVESAARALGLPFAQQRADVRAHARSSGLSIEDAARQLRYAFLFTEARARQAHAVAVGHTADDQVETVLMHLIRGAGTAGLKAMSYRSVLHMFDPNTPLLRPMLGIWRRETLDYCQSHALVARHDRSNDSVEYFRNRVRHELIPALESYNPRVREALWRTAEIAASDLALVGEHVDQAWRQTVQRQGRGFVCFDAGELGAASVPLRRRLFLKAAEELMPAAETSFAALDRAADFVLADASSHLDMGGGLTLTREAGAIFLSIGEQSLPVDAWPQMQEQCVMLQRGIPITVSLANGWQFSAAYMPAAGTAMELIQKPADRLRVCLDADSLPVQLELRPPHAGDRLQPLGLLGHTQKLSDLFVNEKLPVRARGHWPLVCSGETIIWVPGFRPAERFRLKEDTRQAACLAVSRVGV